VSSIQTKYFWLNICKEPPKTLNPSRDIRLRRGNWSSFVISVAKKFNRHMQESSNESSQEQTERSNRKMELKFGFANLLYYM
jgi:hypothetical protein